MTAGEIGARPAPAVLAALAALCAFLLASALSFWPYTVDDAFISLRYGQNLVHTGALVWNPGEAVEGFSNPLWTLYGALLVAAGVPPTLGLKLGGLACALACVPLTFMVARRVGLAPLLAVAAAAVVATNASLALWAVAGLETASFTLLLLLLVWRFEVEMDAPERRPLSSLLLVLVWISRPEAPAYALYLVVRRWRAMGALPLGRRDAVWLAAAGVPLLAYEVAGLLFYGGLFPATHAAKVGGGPPLLEALAAGRLERFLLVRFLFHQGPMFAALWIAGVVAAALGRRRVPVAAWCMGFSGLLFVAYAFTDWMPRYRFLVPPLPFLAIGLCAGFAGLPERLGRVAPPLLLLLIAGAAFDQATRGYDRAHNIALAVEPRGAWLGQVAERAASPWEPGRQELDAWAVLELTEPHETIACPDIGFIGALAGNPVWDIRGLVTPSAAAFLNVPEGDPARAEARRAMLDEMYAAEPALILLPVRPQGMAPTARRFLEALEEDGRIASGYVRRDDLLPARIAWLREDLMTRGGDKRQRVLDGLERLPSYRTALGEARASAYR